MPVFDYRCSSCGTTYDVYHKVREVTNDVVCPSCSSHEYKKLMSVPSVSVSGNSSTDYCSPSTCENGGDCCGGACSMN